MSYKYKNICVVQLKCSHEKTEENAVVTHEALQKYVHIYTSIVSTYAVYTSYKQVSNFLDNKYASTEYRFSAILNHAFSFVRLLRSDGRLFLSSPRQVLG
jgi:hypothetical protein